MAASAVASSAAARMEFRILGPLEVVREGRTLPLGGAKQRLVLALLLLTPNEVVSTDRLIDALWGAVPPRTAANALQYHVSQLRKLLVDDGILVTRDPGYLMRIETEQLDLLRFERLVEETDGTPPDRAARVLRDALALWRGPPLADLAADSSLQSEIRRIEEIRLAALERRLDADLALGRHAQLVPELEALMRRHPNRERLAALLMNALYGSGRQADALGVYRTLRERLVDELGIEPGPALQKLEQAILRQDPALSIDGDGTTPERAILVLVADERRLDDLVALARPLARRPARELILARFLSGDDDLAHATAALASKRAALLRDGLFARIAAYTTADPGGDAARLATEQDVDLLLLEVGDEFIEQGTPDRQLTTILDRAPCDVGVLAGRTIGAAGPVVTPFGAVEHDWSAIEIAAWLAASLGTTLRLLGTAADPTAGRRDASRLLARASLVVQQVMGIVTEPVLIQAGEHGVIDAARGARVLVLGLSDRWRTEGIGSARRAIALGADVPIVFVRRGLRPGGIAPPETLTRFTWTLGPGPDQANAPA